MRTYVTSLASAAGHDPERFYVTIRRRRQTAWLLGPYDTRAEAAGRVPAGRRLAHQADPRTAFDHFGITRVGVPPGQPAPPGKLNHLLEAESDD
jgi:hypothetical protein